MNASTTTPENRRTTSMDRYGDRLICAKTAEPEAFELDDSALASSGALRPPSGVSRWRMTMVTSMSPAQTGSRVSVPIHGARTLASDPPTIPPTTPPRPIHAKDRRASLASKTWLARDHACDAVITPKRLTHT